MNPRLRTVAWAEQAASRVIPSRRIDAVPPEHARVAMLLRAVRDRLAWMGPANAPRAHAPMVAVTAARTAICQHLPRAESSAVPVWTVPCCKRISAPLQVRASVEPRHRAHPDSGVPVDNASVMTWCVRRDVARTPCAPPGVLPRVDWLAPRASTALRDWRIPVLPPVSANATEDHPALPETAAPPAAASAIRRRAWAAAKKTGVFHFPWPPARNPVPRARCARKNV